MIRGLRMGALAVGLAVSAASVAAQPSREEFLSLLHDGRFAAAQRELRRAGDLARPEDLFFDAFTTYWRLIFDDDNNELRETLDAQLAVVIAASDESGSAAPADAALWGGCAHLLLAELRASQRRPLSAAFEAKKAKRLLESPSISGDAATDALFGLGTYNYVADTVPSYVKGLRALLFLPKGNREKGLAQLAAAAEGSRTFGLEARTFLLTIYANSHERLYDRAVLERNRLLERSPESIATLYASARLDLSLGRNESSLRRLAQAEDRARSFGDVDPAVLRSIDLLVARAELAALRPDRAAATAARALAAGNGLGPKIRADLEAVRATAGKQAEGIEWSEIDIARNQKGDAAVYRAAAVANDDRPLLALLAGDAELRGGQAHEALTWFTRASGAGLPPELRPGCEFRQAMAEDLLGQRSQAIAMYKRVAATPGFAAKDAALYYQQSPYGIAP